MSHVVNAAFLPSNMAISVKLSLISMIIIVSDIFQSGVIDINSTEPCGFYVRAFAVQHTQAIEGRHTAPVIWVFFRKHATHKLHRLTLQCTRRDRLPNRPTHAAPRHHGAYQRHGLKSAGCSPRWSLSSDSRHYACILGKLALTLKRITQKFQRFQGSDLLE